MVAAWPLKIHSRSVKFFKNPTPFKLEASVKDDPFCVFKLVELTKQQSQIVHSRHAYRQVIAGAGCGKTMTLVRAIIYQVEQGLDPANLMLITFTRNAASEMKERLLPLLKDSETRRRFKKARIGTFHSVIWHLLKEQEPDRMKNIRILDEKTKNDFIINFSKKNKLSHLSPEILAGFLANRPLNTCDSQADTKTKIQSEYASFKQKRNWIDFDDLFEIFLLKSKIPPVDLIVVDEFQDSGFQEMEFLKKMKPKALLVVGDDWQSIYGFRGSRLENFSLLNKTFKQLKRFYLTKNYRSSQAIVRSTSRFINHCPGVISKKLVSANPQGPKPNVVLYQGGQSYGYLVAQFLKRLPPNERDKSWAVLCRTNDMVRKVESVAGVERQAIADSTFELKVMTIHQSKGLEFDGVIIVGLDQYQIPHPNGSLNEEMRLFYVAMTRARKNLFVFGQAGYNQSSFANLLSGPIKIHVLLDEYHFNRLLDTYWGD